VKKNSDDLETGRDFPNLVGQSHDHSHALTRLSEVAIEQNILGVNCCLPHFMQQWPIPTFLLK
jgi:hypothetical protein